MIKKRFFFPIGQGAFYAEVHDCFSMVYDCGVGRNLKKIPQNARNVIINATYSFLEGDIILFISHFDTDHISGINLLKRLLNRKGAKILCVVMPLLYDLQKSLIVATLKNRGYSDTDLISNPQKYFGEETKIIYVKSTEGENQSEVIHIDSLNKQTTILSGSKLTYLNNYWFFIPYNYDYFPRRNQVIALLNNSNINVPLIISDPNYALSVIKTNPKLLQTIYNSAKGSVSRRSNLSYINENSLFLYSGPDFTASKCLRKVFLNIYIFRKPLFKSLCNHFIKNRLSLMGCIYTGDGNLKKVNLSAIYSNYMKNVGTVQIPHHGSANNYNPAFFQKTTFICPMSTGYRYKSFPAYTVINPLINSNNIPINVTERRCLVQIF